MVFILNMLLVIGCVVCSCDVMIRLINVVYRLEKVQMNIFVFMIGMLVRWVVDLLLLMVQMQWLSGVLVVSQQFSMRKLIISQIGRQMLSRVLDLRVVKLVLFSVFMLLRFGQVFLLLNSSVELWVMYIMFKVQINGVMLKWVIIVLLIRLISMLKIVMQRIIFGILKKRILLFYSGRLLVSSVFVIMLQIFVIVLMDKLMLLVRMISVMLMVSRLVIVMCWVMISRLEVVRKLGIIMLKNVIISRRVIKVWVFSRYI